jgi:Domain of unknown function (DUF222)/HNH endonuclease
LTGASWRSPQKWSDELCGSTGARSLAALIAWKLGSSSRNAHTITAVASRLEDSPCVEGLREGRLSLDQVGVIAERASDGSDEHYAALAEVASVSQLRTAVKLEPRPQPDRRSPNRPPLPGACEAFMRLVEAGWDADAARRPHGQHTTVVVHVDVKDRVASLHLGPLLSNSERRYLTCDATCEVWFERVGQVIGSGRATRVINRRLRRALEHRHPMCAVPGCGATRGLHAHHIRHWEDGGPTELDNLVLVCPYHHRLHHQGVITITGPGSLARPPTKPPPSVPPYRGPTGERADWWWCDPFQPQPPPTNN